VVAELTTVADDEAVVHDGLEVRRHQGLSPGTAQELDGFSFTTLPRPGERLATFATANDVHFGETVCGLIDGTDVGPVFTVEPGEDPYPEVMNRGAVEEIAVLDPDVVLVKGDLTSNGTQSEYDAFRALWGGAFESRLHVIRGNHEAYHELGPTSFDLPRVHEVELPGVRLAMVDTSKPGRANGGLEADQLEWLDELCVRSDRPVLVFGHHHVWDVEAGSRQGTYFGIEPDSSELLVALAARRPAFTAYFAGHTHRNRVRRFSATGAVPWVEVACVKDYPGTWAEYRVHEQGVLQVHRRISTHEALLWTEKTRHMYDGAYAEYAFGALDERCFLIGWRS
jgi:3',5'-cyclic AMP phosphodiesterase CpdA